ncbi:hypothetical protein HXX76_009895 [Chlamydomonas incerta]|uniref:Ribosomal protein L6 alpha-beta domain-containing protein n=1 Tax=Chlamydomonas incerta TaxID=51695 RepID=A0A835SW12_CHLIN|nr:hypothetical protein HXX76_009895 [Chlamydomonas incerta]|eukprot:KAG2430923.1 hypothetical protein HXX76_009895 [Chlamydomonas incerta]
MFGLSRSAWAGTSTLISPANSGALQQLLQHGLDTARGVSAVLEAASGASEVFGGAASGCAASTSTSWPSAGAAGLHTRSHARAHSFTCGTAPAAALGGASSSAPTSGAVAGGAALQLQAARGYRIPYKVLLPKTPYSERVGRPAPQPWPELEPVKGGAEGPAGAAGAELRWHRSVVRFPPEVTAELEGRVLVVSGKAGSVRLDLQELDPTGLLAFRLIHLPPPPASSTSSASASASASSAGAGRSLLALVSPDKGVWEGAAAALNGAIRGVMAGYLVGLAVKGVGYRMEPAELPAAQAAVQQLSVVSAKRRSRAPGGADPKPYYFESPNAPGAAAAAAAAADKGGKGGAAVTFPYNKPASAIRLKVGYSRPVVYPLPPHVRAFFLKPTLLYLYGLELDELRRVAAEVRSIRPPNAYTGNGVTYVDEVVRLKARKGAK